MKIVHQVPKASPCDAVDTFAIVMHFNAEESLRLRQRNIDLLGWCSDTFGRYGKRWAIAIPASAPLSAYFQFDADACAFTLRWLSGEA